MRRAEPSGINTYLIGKSNKDPERFPWGSYETRGHISRFREGISTPLLKPSERHEWLPSEIEREIIKKFGDGDYIYAPSKKGPRSGYDRYVVMRLLEGKAQ